MVHFSRSRSQLLISSFPFHLKWCGSYVLSSEAPVCINVTAAPIKVERKNSNKRERERRERERDTEREREKRERERETERERVRERERESEGEIRGGWVTEFKGLFPALFCCSWFLFRHF